MTQNSTHAPRKKAYVETYGCQMNISDGELMQGILASGGYDLAATPEEADVILVNTCAIREHAEQRVIGRVSELNRHKLEKPELVIGVTGCMAQRLGTTLLEQAPYVDLVMGPDGYRGLPATIARLRPDAAAARTPKPRAVRGVALPVLANVQSPPNTDIELEDGRLAMLSFDAEENYEGLAIQRSSGISAWISVQRGCNHRCTYCIVPYVRGSEKNRDPQHVLAEIRAAAEQGITEVTLLGQTVNSWLHGDWTFADLLRAVARVDGIRRVRFTSPHPNDVTPELVAVMADEPHVCKQLHLPVQSGSDRVLRRMLRRYTVASYLEKVRMVRAAMPDIALSTDVIVGFPGESDADYEATLALMHDVRFDDAYLYKYSLRDGTPATRLPAEDFIADDVAQARLERIITEHRIMQAELNAARVGRIEEVLVERVARSAGDMLGRTDANNVIAFPGAVDLLGSYATVRITHTTGATFRGELCEVAAAV